MPPIISVISIVIISKVIKYFRSVIKMMSLEKVNGVKKIYN